MIFPIPPEYESPDIETSLKEREDRLREHSPEADVGRYDSTILIRSDGFHPDDDQYIIDPDYMDLMQIDDFNQMIRRKK